METQSVDSKLAPATCGRCASCRCGKRGAAPPEIEAAFRAVHTNASFAVSITAMPVSGAESAKANPCSPVKGDSCPVGRRTAALRRRGCRIYILSGDRVGKVNAMADRLGLSPENCIGELSPDAKGMCVRELDNHDTLYLGDGANDSLAVDAAWLAGTPAIDRGLLEQKAGFYFLGRGLRGVRALLEVAAQRRRTARAVVGFAIVYNVFAITLCLAGRMNPLLAAILMPASSLVSLGIVLAGFSRGAPQRA